MNAKEREKQEAIERLKQLIKPGDTVYGSIKHVSRSGMSRIIDFHIMVDNKPFWVTPLIGKACGYSRNNKFPEGLKVSGCGMNMIFAVVYDLSQTLYGDGFTCLGRDDEKHVYCPSNDHSNGDRNYEPHLHKSGGYALKYGEL